MNHAVPVLIPWKVQLETDPIVPLAALFPAPPNPDEAPLLATKIQSCISTSVLTAAVGPEKVF